MIGNIKEPNYTLKEGGEGLEIGDEIMVTDGDMPHGRYEVIAFDYKKRPIIWQRPPWYRETHNGVVTVLDHGLKTGDIIKVREEKETK